MKWTVLSDNRTDDCMLQTEHGLSVLLETGRYRILLDTGAGDVFVRNAEILGIDLSTVDYVFISHGHSDHAGGLRHFMAVNDHAKVIVSPDAVSGRFFSKRKGLHSITVEWPEGVSERLLLVNDTQEIAEGLHIIAHIPQSHPMPKGNRHLFVQSCKDCASHPIPLGGIAAADAGEADADGNYVNDDFRHELALYTDGLLFTGCAHSGLENILAACPKPVRSVVGGFHLLDDHESEEELLALAQRLMESYPDTQFHTSHCTGDKVFATLKSVMKERLQPFSAGMVSV